MASRTKIEWTDVTWNPVTGCSKVSQGCKNCYAERMAKRLKAMGVERYHNEFELTLQPDLAELPLKWTKPRMIFVNSMSDLFHEKVPDDYILRVFTTMLKADWHIFQILTKRSERLMELAPSLPWPAHVWMGVSVENNSVLHRVDHLRKTAAKVKFLSCEPLIGPLVGLSIESINWVIVGGESGPSARPMKKEWVLQIRQRCGLAQVPFFFKQWGGTRKDLTGRELEGRTFDAMPVHASKFFVADRELSPTSG
jgi:protein gp37